MKKRFIISTVAFACLLSSCGKTSLNASLGSSFRMMPNQKVDMAKTDLKINGFEVVEDSRCPEETNCIWEGQVVASFIINDAQVKMNTQSAKDTLGYTFKILSVSPVKTNADIPWSDYIIELLITK
ncbi:hypothetical protein [Putridiphycobacter roseus]|nr:hypothetical protein [Putridiphycobacter roseus]